MSKRNTVLVGFVATALSAVIGACGVPNVGPSSSGGANDRAQRSGLDIAETQCAACHAIGRDGASPHADALEFRNFSKFYPIEDLAEALAEGIYVGHPDMPVFQFEPDEVDVLIDYIQAVQAPRET